MHVPAHIQELAAKYIKYQRTDEGKDVTPEEFGVKFGIRAKSIERMKASLIIEVKSLDTSPKGWVRLLDDCCFICAACLATA